MRKRFLAIGIDPGATGAVAFIPHGGAAWGEIVNTADGVALAELIRGQLREGWNVHVGIEKVHSMPGNAASSMFKFGKSAGVPEGVCAALQLPVTLVTPKQWNDLAFTNETRPKEKRARKDASRLLASRRWPTASLTRKKDEAVAEALWIAEIIRRQENS